MTYTSFSSLDIAGYPHTYPSDDSSGGILISGLIAAVIIITAVIYRVSKKKNK